MSDPLERTAIRLAAALRSVAREARLPLTTDEDPTEILARLASRLDAAASDIERALAVIFQDRQREMMLRNL